MRAPNGTLLLYFRVNDLGDHRACLGDGTTYGNSSAMPTYVPRRDLSPADPEGKGSNIYVAWTDGGFARGAAWRVRRVRMHGTGQLHVSNPSVTFVRGVPGAALMMAFRFNGAGGEHNGFATAASFQGPFTLLSNLSHQGGNDEDPYIWQDAAAVGTTTTGGAKVGARARGASAGCAPLHILYHNAQRGLHAFSGDCGVSWRKSPTGSIAFSLNLTLSDGSVFALARRERPELRWDAASGAPTHLWNGANTVGAALPGQGQGQGNKGRPAGASGPTSQSGQSLKQSGAPESGHFARAFSLTQSFA